MDTSKRSPERVPRFRRGIAAAGLIGSGLVAGAVIGGMHVAGAATKTPTTAAAAADRRAFDPNHGAPGEMLLTGTTAAKVKAAALKAVPGATVIRVETDSEGSPYEAHLQKADGSVVTVKIDKNFNVTQTIDGFGMGGPHGPGAPSNGSTSSSSSPSSGA